MASTKGKRASSSPSAGLMPLEDMPIEDVWQEYQLTRTERIRNVLAEHYRHVAVRTAERVHRKFPSEVDIDDVTSVATIGMIKAIDSFQPDRKVKFETYCAQHVQGAIYDELRAVDWVPRLVRIRVKQVERAREALRSKLGRPPTDKEVQRKLGASDAEFEKIMRDASPVQMGSLDRPIRQQQGEQDLCEIDVITDRSQKTPLNMVQDDDQMRALIRDFTRAERLIVILYYHEEMTMKEIGLTLDLSESRVSQLHTAILKRMRAQLANRPAEV